MFVPSSELGPPPPNPQRMLLPPLGPRAERPNSDEGTDTLVLYVYYNHFTLLHAAKLPSGWPTETFSAYLQQASLLRGASGGWGGGGTSCKVAKTPISLPAAETSSAWRLCISFCIILGRRTSFKMAKGNSFPHSCTRIHK